jgi:hypothetical protein
MLLRQTVSLAGWAFEQGQVRKALAWKIML